MNPLLNDWLNLVFRLLHIIFAIMWIGSSFYFVWLDAALEPPKKKEEHVEGELWMVHSGGFYQVQKTLIRPGMVPKVLHWFKWEATFTWLTGFALMMVVYHLRDWGVSLVDEKVYPLAPSTAILISIASLVVSWFIYDFIWRLIGNKIPWLGHLLTAVFVVSLSYGLTHLFVAKAAFLHVGAILATWMVVNVWVHILPYQQIMIDDANAGKIPDYSMGKHAKHRSMHNSYMTIPVIFMMVSNHYPQVFASSLNWLVLMLLFVFGACLRHLMITHEQQQTAYWVFAPALVSLGLSVFLCLPAEQAGGDTGGEKVPYAKVQQIVANRCLSCHSSEPSDEEWTVAPKGFVMDTKEQILSKKALVKAFSVDSTFMPFNNKTEMTDEERKILGQWLKQSENEK